MEPCRLNSFFFVGPGMERKEQAGGGPSKNKIRQAIWGAGRSDPGDFRLRFNPVLTRGGPGGHGMNKPSCFRSGAAKRSTRGVFGFEKESGFSILLGFGMSGGKRGPPAAGKNLLSNVFAVGRPGAARGGTGRHCPKGGFGGFARRIFKKPHGAAA